MTYHVILWAFVFDCHQQTKDVVFDNFQDAQKYFESLRTDWKSLKSDVIVNWWDFGIDYDHEDWSDNDIYMSHVNDEYDDYGTADMVLYVTMIKSSVNLVKDVDYSFEDYNGNWMKGNINNAGSLLELYIENGASVVEELIKGYGIGWFREPLNKSV